MSPAPWFLPLSSATNPNPGWARSTNAGASYGAPGTVNLPTSQVTGPHGQDRFRQTFTIPALTTGVLAFTVSGDIYSNEVPDPAEVIYDGVSLGNVNGVGGAGGRAGPETFTVPATPGVHTVTLLIGSAIIGGVTNPLITAELFQPVPCNCCPLPKIPPRCVVGSGNLAFPFLCCLPLAGATYEIDWQYAHRNRSTAGETAQLRIGDATTPLGTNPIVDTHTAGPGAGVWTLRSGTIPIGTGFPQIRMEFQALAPGGGVGNFLDACSIILRRVTPSAANLGEQLTNGGFEFPVTGANTNSFPSTNTAGIGWRTTDPCNCLEIWHNSFLGVSAFAGVQFVEMNAFVNATLFQVATLETCDQQIVWYDSVTGNSVPPANLQVCP
jgi:hypothetical protein